MNRLAAACVCAALAAGCRASRPPLQAVTLPDLSASAPEVQSKIRAASGSLQQRLADRSMSPADVASAYGELGAVLFAAEYLDAASVAFADARLLAPDDMRWPYYLAQVSRFRQEPARAAQLFGEALRLRPDDEPSLVWLGEMELVQGHDDSAAAAFGRAADIDPGSASAHYGLGRIALSRRDYRKAIDELETAARLAPDATRIQNPLGLAYERTGDATRAAEHFRRRGDGEVITRDPLMAQLRTLVDTAAAHERRGAAALEQQQWSSAIAELRQAIALAPDRAATHLNLGTALYMSGDDTGGVAELKAATRLSPSLASAHYSLGVILGSRGEDREAIDELSAAVNADDGMVQARLELANALRRAGRPADALAEYTRVLAVHPDESPARFGYAMALVRLRRYRDARDWLDVAARRSPGEPGFAHALARLLAAAPDAGVRNGPRAVALTGTLLQTDGSIAIAETRAMALAEVGQFGEAVQWQQDIIAAAEKAGDRARMAYLNANLARYRRGEPCREPWPDDDPVFYPRPADARSAARAR